MTGREELAVPAIPAGQQNSGRSQKVRAIREAYPQERAQTPVEQRQQAAEGEVFIKGRGFIPRTEALAGLPPNVEDVLALQGKRKWTKADRARMLDLTREWTAADKRKLEELSDWARQLLATRPPIWPQPAAPGKPARTLTVPDATGEPVTILSQHKDGIYAIIAGEPFKLASDQVRTLQEMLRDCPPTVTVKVTRAEPGPVEYRAIRVKRIKLDT